MCSTYYDSFDIINKTKWEFLMMPVRPAPEDSGTWLVKSTELREGEGLGFNRQKGVSLEDVMNALAAQYPDGSVKVSHTHGSATYIRKVTPGERT